MAKKFDLFPIIYLDNTFIYIDILGQCYVGAENRY